MSARRVADAGTIVGVTYVVEDDRHCELIGTYATEEQALGAIRVFARLGWDQEPNQAPCMSWKTCGRLYVVTGPLDQRREVLDVSAAAIVWLDPSAAIPPEETP